MNASLGTWFRSLTRLLATLVVGAVLASACGSVEIDVESGTTDIGESEDTGSEDTGSEDTGSEDTSSEDTSSEDTGSSDTDADTSADAIPDNPVVGVSLSQFTDDANDDAVGQPAPNLDGVSLKGDRIQIDQADGRGKIYGFFAHWCPHCQAEVPLLVDYLETNRLPENVDFHAISTAVDESRDNYPPIDWFDTENWPFPVLDDSQMSAIAAGFGLSAFPFFVIVDGDGAVVQRIAGGLPDETAIAALIALAEGS